MTQQLSVLLEHTCSWNTNSKRRANPWSGGAVTKSTCVRQCAFFYCSKLKSKTIRTVSTPSEQILPSRRWCPHQCSRETTLQLMGKLARSSDLLLARNIVESSQAFAFSESWDDAGRGDLWSFQDLCRRMIQDARKVRDEMSSAARRFTRLESSAEQSRSTTTARSHHTATGPSLTLRCD